MDAYEMIMEDENIRWQLLISALPLARTPMDKKFGKSLTKYASNLRKEVEKMLTPWIEARRIKRIKERLARPPESKTYDENGNEVDLNNPDWWKREV